MTTITLPRADIPMVNGAVPSRDWYRWARDITTRVGGVSGTGSGDIEDVANEALQRSWLVPQGQQGNAAAEEALARSWLVPQAVPVRDVLSLMEVRAFIHAPRNEPQPDEAQFVLAGRIFNR